MPKKNKTLCVDDLRHAEYYGINSHLTATSAVPVAAEGITTVAAMAPAAGLCCLSLLLL